MNGRRLVCLMLVMAGSALNAGMARAGEFDGDVVELVTERTDYSFGEPITLLMKYWNIGDTQSVGGLETKRRLEMTARVAPVSARQFPILTVPIPHACTLSREAYGCFAYGHGTTALGSIQIPGGILMNGDYVVTVSVDLTDSGTTIFQTSPDMLIRIRRPAISILPPGPTPNPTPPGPLPGPALTLSANPAAVQAGGTVDVFWSGVSNPVRTDWIALALQGSANTSYVAWVYTSSCTRAAGAGPKAAGNCTVSVPAAAGTGTYEFRLFANNGYTKLATSNAVTATKQ